MRENLNLNFVQELVFDLYKDEANGKIFIPKFFQVRKAFNFIGERFEQFLGFS